ncbi:MAG TPA: asparagine synthase (glutamine-hydrolyzing), partial [Candidatus Norongarragalinales archaeon]|nr:asparagine synthase (glutamine-hydrolyzing) [Candidatus Norongarragalinales archaeon]
YYIDDDVMLGNRRLKIIDLSPNGRQPIFNEDRTVCVVFNGEIYNFKILRHELEKSNHRFTSDTDTEVLVHAYEEWGDDFVQKLRGMFAFALWDSNKKRLLLARDHACRKPLYFSEKQGVLYFASEIKALFEAMPARVDPGNFRTFLSFHYVPGSGTVFSGIQKLLPSQILVADKEGIRIRKYWDPKPSFESASDEEWLLRLEHLLSDNAALKSVADVPVGSFLSGGLDSTTLIAYVKPHIPYEFHTFSIGFEQYGSELYWAEKAADFLGTTHHSLNVTPEMGLSCLEKLAWHYDEPIADPASVPVYFLSELARKHVTVAFTGQGADELFAEKAQYALCYELGTAWKAASLLRPVWKALADVSPRKAHPEENRIERILTFLSQPDLDHAFVSYAFRAMTDAETLQLTGRAPEPSVTYPPENLKDPLLRQQYLDLRNTLAEKYLMVSDKASMAHSLETRTFFLDPTFLNFAFNLPASLKVRKGEGKYLLKQAAVRKGLPKDLVFRQKQGFGYPVHRLIANEWRSAVEDRVEQSELLKRMCEPSS